MNLPLKSNLILAPMAGITDLPFRMLNRRFGCELAFIEMLNARSVSYKSRKTQQMLSTCAKDRPLGVQLLGCEEKFILRAMDTLSRHKFDILDFNAACPAKKVVRRGEGAALLKEPKRLGIILRLLVKNSPIPVSVKIRTGWDNNSINAREVSLLAQDAGVSAVFIHGRTKTQEYGGDADYGTIAAVKKTLKVPVIASGNIFDGVLARKMLDETGCDGLLVARGALGNPWIFKEIGEFLKSGRAPERPGRNEIVSVMLGHLCSYVEFYGERNGVVIFRKFYSWYTRGLRSVRRLRERSSRVKTKTEAEEIIKEAFDAKVV